jgi:hypothetical protein
MFFAVHVQQTSTPDAIVAAVNSIVAFITKYVAAIAAVGALAMTLIEAIKKLLDSRTKFQAKRWTEWTERWSLAVAAGMPPVSKAQALADVISLCTGVTPDDAKKTAGDLLTNHGKLNFAHAFRRDPAHALFALEIERMMGSIQEAADIAIASPKRYPSLYAMVTSGADLDDVVEWHNESDTKTLALADQTPTPEDRKLIKETADRFGRLRQVAKRSLDGFQLYTAESWASKNQTAANVLGAVLMFVGLMQTADGSSHLGKTILVSLLGGVLAPVAKDLVTGLKRVGNG